jgi:hypothetical protein
MFKGAVIGESQYLNRRDKGAKCSCAWYVGYFLIEVPCKQTLQEKRRSVYKK